MVNYWIFKVKDETGGIYGRRGWAIFEHRLKEHFWGIPELTEKGKPEANLTELQPGDHALFYLISKERGGRFLGSAVLDSEFVHLNEEQTQQLVHKEFIDHAQGVFLRDAKKWNKPIALDYLREKVSFISGGTKAGLFFQGSLKKIKNPSDYHDIMREHELIE